MGGPVQLLPRLRLLLVRHPVAYWCAVVLLAASAAWLVHRQLATAEAARAECAARAAPEPTTEPADLAAPAPGEVAVPLHGIPGAIVGARVRVYAIGAQVADGRVVEVLGDDVLVAVAADVAGAVSLTAAEGTAQLGLLGPVDDP